MSAQYDEIIKVIEHRKKVLERALEYAKKQSTGANDLYEKICIRYEAQLEEIESILSTCENIVKPKEVQ